MVNITATLSTLITANHILHYHDVVDAYGHISVRNPDNASTFFLSGYLAPALVSSPSDIVEYLVENGEPVDPNAGQGYKEKYIHSEVLKRFPDVNCVVHSHSEAVIPYSIVDVPLEPSYHMAGFLGEDVPVFDIAQYYNSTTPHDMLISDTYFGAALASYFSASNTTPANSTATQPTPNNTVVLMRSHGFTTVGQSIEETVYRAIYAASSARVQTMAIQLAALTGAGGQLSGAGGVVRYLSGRERVDTRVMNEATQDRPWKLWVREVETYPGGLYRNDLGSPPGA